LSDFAGLRKEFEKTKREYFNKQLEPQGWALSLNIKSVAEKKNITKCPQCSVPFEFEERMGWYHCPMCQARGGIKKLVAMALSRRTTQ